MSKGKIDGLSENIARVLKERLDQFKVPSEVQFNIKSEILALIAVPEKKPYGACVMTQAASEAGDRQRKGQGMPGDSKPEII